MYAVSRACYDIRHREKMRDRMSERVKVTEEKEKK